MQQPINVDAYPLSLLILQQDPAKHALIREFMTEFHARAQLARYGVRLQIFV